jgi:hypothetical protein
VEKYLNPNLSDYIEAGYAPQMGCNLQAALEYVAWSEGYPTLIKGEQICLSIEGMTIPTPYYWENDLLLKASSH